MKLPEWFRVTDISRDVDTGKLTLHGVVDTAHPDLEDDYSWPDYWDDQPAQWVIGSTYHPRAALAFTDLLGGVFRDIDDCPQIFESRDEALDMLASFEDKSSLYVEQLSEFDRMGDPLQYTISIS